MQIPDGIDYQWATVSVCGDRSLGNLKKFEETGWRKVPKMRHPEERSIDPTWIEYGGQVLVERPKYLTERARRFEQAKADAQLITAMSGMSFVNRTSGREISAKSVKIASKRRRNIKEFFVFHVWRLKSWTRNWWAGRK